MPNLEFVVNGEKHIVFWTAYYGFKVGDEIRNSVRKLFTDNVKDINKLGRVRATLKPKHIRQIVGHNNYKPGDFITFPVVYTKNSWHEYGRFFYVLCEDRDIFLLLCKRNTPNIDGSIGYDVVSSFKSSRTITDKEYWKLEAMNAYKGGKFVI